MKHLEDFVSPWSPRKREDISAWSNGQVQSLVKKYRAYFREKHLFLTPQVFLEKMEFPHTPLKGKTWESSPSLSVSLSSPQRMGILWRYLYNWFIWEKKILHTKLYLFWVLHLQIRFVLFCSIFSIQGQVQSCA